MRRRLYAAWCLASALALLGALPGAAAEWSVLVFSKTAGFRHASIDEGITLVETLGEQHGFTVEATEDAADFSASNLERFRVVVWLNTTGDVLTPGQQADFEDWVRSGGGWVGVHSAADTEAAWPFYGELLGNGAWFANHPAIQEASIDVAQPLHVSTAHLPSRFDFVDEWYNFESNPRPAVQVLLTIDESSYQPGAGAMGTDHPIAWCHDVDAGRSWYSNLGHREETYSEPAFAEHLLGGILWAAGRVFADDFESGDTSLWHTGP